VRDIDQLFQTLETSPFRRRFRLAARERAYRGLPAVLQHAGDFIEQRLTPAAPANDGKQRPFRGHPVFVAQHDTATRCRSCLAKWHRIPQGRRLTVEEQRHIGEVLEHWLKALATSISTGS